MNLYLTDKELEVVVHELEQRAFKLTELIAKNDKYVDRYKAWREETYQILQRIDRGGEGKQTDE
jgi:hypothetical protein